MFLRYNKWSMLWALIILILCGLPGKDIPHISFLDIISFDKFVHAGMFFVLTLLTVRGFTLQTNFKSLHVSPKIFAFIICVAYGGSLEIMQGTVCEGRSADVFDFIANTFGCSLALIFYSRIENRILVKIIK